MTVIGAAAALLLGVGGTAAAAVASGGSSAAPSSSAPSSSAASAPPSKPSPTSSAAPSKSGPSGAPTTKPTGSPGSTSAPDPHAVHVLAGILHVSDARAAQVLETLDRIEHSSSNRDPVNPQFVALAASLHLTVQQLVADLQQFKQQLAAAAPQSPPPGKN